MFNRTKVVQVTEEVTLDEIKKRCARVLRRYDAECKQRPAGKKGIARRNRFEALVKAMDQQTPREAAIALYNFYHNESPAPRLVNHIKNELFGIFAVMPPRFSVSVYQTAGNVMWAENELRHKVDALKVAEKQEHGVAFKK